MTGPETQPVLTFHIREVTGCFRFLWDPSLWSVGHSKTRWPIPERPCQARWMGMPWPTDPTYLLTAGPLHALVQNLISICTSSPSKQDTQPTVKSTSSISCLSEVRILSLFGGYYEVSVNEWSGIGSRTLARKCGWLGNVFCSLGLGHVINVGLIYSTNNYQGYSLIKELCHILNKHCE